jgi:O-antigen/teichoic acid export membrane protein
MQHSKLSKPYDAGNFSHEDINKLAKGSGTTLIGELFGKGLFFLTQLLLAWFLGVEAFGLYSLGLALARSADIFARLGLSTGGMMFVSTYKDHSPENVKGVILSAVGISLMNGILIGSGIYFCAHVLAVSVFQKPELSEVFKLFSFSIPMVAAMTTFSSLLQGFHSTKYTVYIKDFVQPITNLICIVLFAYAGNGLPGVIFSFTLSHLFGFMSSFYYLNKIFPGFFARTLTAVYPLKSLVTYSTPLLFVGVLNYFLVWTDTLLLGIFASSSAVGIYRAASQVPFILTVFLHATNSIYAPVAADLYQKREIQRLGNMLKTSTRWVTYITVPLFLFLVFSSKEIMTLFGNEYVPIGSTVLIILSFGQLMNCLTGGVGYTLTMTGKQNVELGNSFALAMVSVSLNLLLIPQYGALGTAFASGSSTCVINVLRVIEIYILYKFSPFSGILLPILLPTICSVCILPFLTFDINYIFKLIINMGLLTLVFGIAIKTSKMAEEDKYIISLFKNKLLSKATRAFS